MISLAGGLPDPDGFPTAELRAIADDAFTNDAAAMLQYGLTSGDATCRDAMARFFDSADPEDLVITTGSQQGLDLVARVLIDPGDVVVTAAAEYLGLVQVLAAHDAEAHPVPMDADGLDVDALEAALRRGLQPKACYLVPHHHNPTGATIDPERRLRLHELAARWGFVVIDDDPYRELYYDGVPPAEPAADPEWRVRLRSTSKMLAPGLRVGMIDAPSALRDAIVIAKQSTDLHTAPLTQRIVARALDAPWLPAHLASLRATYGPKRDRLVDRLEDRFGNRVQVNRPSGGMFVWADFAGVDTTAWLARALDAGVCFVPGASFGTLPDLASRARFSFATASLADLDVAVERLVATIGS